MDSLHQNIAHLSPKQRELLDLRLRREKRQVNQADIIVRRKETNVAVPLSFAQQQLWFVDQMEGGSTHYNVPIAIRLHGYLDTNALEKALQEIVRRHEVLRTTFHAQSGQPVQMVHPFQPIAIAHIKSHGEEHVTSTIQEAVRSPFDFTQDHLLRLLLFYLSEDEHIFVLVSHHIVMDGWSVHVLVQELTALYHAYLKGDASPLPSLPIQYADYAAWQRGWSQREDYQHLLKYWRQQLDGIPALLELPGDYPRPAVQSFRGSFQVLELSETILQEATATSRQENVTLFMFLLATFYVLLWRYSQQDDLVVGTPIASRTHQETRGLIGYFANMLVLRTHLSAALTFQQLLQAVRKMALEAYKHQDMPFEQLVGELNPERQLSYTPLFQVLFNVQQADASAISLPNLKLEMLRLESEIAKFDLSMSIIETPRKLLVSLEYSTDLFTSSTIKRLLQQYQLLLEAVVQSPQQTIISFPLMTAHEQQDLIQAWNYQQQQTVLSQVCIHELIEAQAALTPDAIALSMPGLASQVSYQQLDRASNQLAHYLHKQHVGVETRIGLYMERSPDVLIALLAIMKAGGTYIPLDPTLPAERLHSIVTDASVALIICSDEYDMRIYEGRVPFIFLQQAQSYIALESDAHLKADVSAENLAYILYTSGSTGEPKGVAVPHRGVVNYCLDMMRQYDYRPQDRVLQFASLSFDTSCEEIYPTLFAGATLVLRDDEMAASLHIFSRRLETWAISIVNVPTAFWHRWCRELIRMAELASMVRLVVVGGEQAQAQVLEQWTEYAGSTVRWINTYGPTETSIVALRYDPHVHGRDIATGVPIGRPIEHVQAYVLDYVGQPVPTGVLGELYIGGRGVTRGYLGLPEQTAEAFIPDAFGLEPGARLYRTGDLVRYLSNGNFLFLGRNDRQIKLRGYRIDLNEIVAVLRRFKVLKDVLVEVYGNNADEQRLVAYVIASDVLQPPSSTEMYQYAQENLPTYMIPAMFIALDAFPLNTHGKIDKHALPQPAEQAHLHEEEIGFVGSENTIEQIVGQIWGDVLQLVKINVHANFFASGGHSLLAMSLLARLNATFRIEMSVRTLFEHPTVSKLARKIEELRGEAIVAETVPVLRAQAREILQLLPLSFEQQRLWFLDRFESNSSLYTIPLAFRVHGPLRLDLLEHSFQQVVQRHEILRTIFVEREGYPYQQVQPEQPLELFFLDLNTLTERQQEEAVHKYLQEAIQRPFDLAHEQLIRVQLLRLNEQKHVLLIQLHHIVFDGWSTTLLLREVAQIYTALMANDQSPLPILPIQYADFALWQREQLQGVALTRLEDYWREQLQGAPVLLELPTDHPRPQHQSFRGAMQHWDVPEALVQGLMRCCREQDVTLFMLMLTSFAVLLGRLSQQDDVVIGTPIANRTRGETEHLIGCFANTLALRLRIPGQAPFETILAQTREQSLEAYAHQDLPFEQLVELLNPPRQMAAHPLFQVLLNVQQALGDVEVEGAGLRWQMEPLEGSQAKFDLNLGVHLQGAQMRLVLEYSLDLFEPESIMLWLERYQGLLDAVVHDPSQLVSELPLLTRCEQLQIEQWNRLPTWPTHLATLPELVDAQAWQRPDAVAVVIGDEQLSYGKLVQHSNQLARYLREQHVGPEVGVGVCLERSIALVVVLLAILKAGGAYVPLDPSYPAERLAFMLSDAQISLLLTQEHLLGLFPDEICSTTNVLCLEQEAHTIADFSDQTPDVLIIPQTLAYIIYTSGSTGCPKGTLITHENVIRLLQATGPDCQFGHMDSWSLFHAYAFDLSVWEIWGALCSGGRLVVVPVWTARDPQAFIELLVEQQITVLTQTPSAFRQLVVQEEEQERLWAGALRLIIFAGEALEAGLVVRWFERHADIPRLLNMYGITETTVHVTMRWVERIKVGLEKASVVGWPIAGWQVYLLDQSGGQIPVGAVGELYVGGSGLARGYLRQASLTAERFLPHPWSGQPGARLYRTGDLGRYRLDGSIEYLGRADHQVKIRGFRVELGEIEVALQQQAGVSSCVVLARTDPLGEQHLVAYVIGSADYQDQSLHQVWRQQLRQRLPEYMLPTHFVMVNVFPLTSSGKIDWRALLQLELKNTSDEQMPFQTELTITEQMLAGLWAEVLQIEAIGPHENFFEKGGHSLLAIKLLSRIRSVFQLDLPVRALFEEPTVAGLSTVIETMRRTDAVAGHVAIQPRSIVSSKMIPLSFEQQRLWFLDRFESNSSLYTIPLVFRVQGPLHPAWLEQACNDVIQRHEILRTVFVEHDGQAYQQVQAAQTLTIPLVDFQMVPDEQREAVVRGHVQEAIQQAFDLTHGPLWRVELLQVAQQEQVVLILLHHIIFDGWSTTLLLQELTQCYAAHAHGSTPHLPPLPIQYADFALWQREQLQGVALTCLENYWREQLQGAPILLELPTDHPRPAVQSFRGATKLWTVPDYLAQGLIRCSREQDVTLFMFLLASFAVLLGRLSQQEDVVIGTPIANRMRGETEQVIGCFTNTLALRVRVPGAASFQTVLAQAREQALEAYAHQDLPFEHLVEALNPPRQLAAHPLFQVLLNVQQGRDMAALDLDGLRWQMEYSEELHAKFDLNLAVSVQESQMRLALEYSLDLFEPASIDRLLERYQCLLEAVVQNPAQYLYELPILGKREQAQLEQWSQGAGGPAPLMTVPDLIDAQARQRPDACALVMGEEHLSYGELVRHTDQLAQALIAQGIRAEVTVGIALERSLALVISLLAVLKAGGAYVPLDPTIPQERLAYYIQDAQLSLILTQAQIEPVLPAFAGPILCVDRDWHLISLARTQSPHLEIDPQQLAYIIYTSGSTGVPKGAMNAHAGVCNRLHWMKEHYQLGPHERFLQKTPISFDVSVGEIFTPLISGASLVLAVPAGHKDPHYLAEVVEREAITTVHFVPSMLRFYLEEPGLERCRALRRVMCSGEALTPALQERFFQRFTGVELHNLYGPTETAVEVSFWNCQGEATVHAVPIGQPIRQVSLYVLDERLQSLPVGVPGELYIGGIQVGRGYMQQADRTAEVFVPDPFGTGGRLYKTGDLARWRTDGSLEYLGRRDQQVKIRGFRVELGEIEAALQQQKEVRACAVVMWEDDGGEQHLVAYVVGIDDHDFHRQQAQEHWRQQLRQRLPEYMLPTYFIWLDALPLTSSGKIDRHSLPKPEVSQPGAYLTIPQATLTATEQMLGQVWADVLHLNEVGPQAHFFESGGHSLLAIALLARIRVIFRIDLPVRAIFEAPTLARLAKVIDAARQMDMYMETAAIPMRPERLQLSPLSFAQQRLWFLDRFEPKSSFYTIPLIFRVQGLLHPAWLEQACNDVIQRHEILRTVFVEHDGQAYQQVQAAQTLTIPLVDFQMVPDEQREAVVRGHVQEAIQQAFDLTHGPLWRVELLQLAQQEQVVLILLHHIIFDGWSTTLLLQELTQCYAAHGSTPHLPPLPIQYADFALWQREQLQGVALTRLEDYWREQLQGAPILLELPTDHPRPAVQSFRGATKLWTVPDYLAQGLIRCSREQDVTLFMFLLTSFAVLLGRLSQQEDVVIGTPIANRMRGETEQVIGCFTNTLALRVQVPGAASFQTVLAQAREQALEAYAHQDLPFEHLVEVLNPPRQLAAHPLFQVLLNVQQVRDMPVLDLDGLRWQMEPSEEPYAKFDLNLAVSVQGSHMQLALEYSLDLFEPTSIDRLLERYQCLLEAIIRDPEQRLYELPILGEREQALLEQWSQGAGSPKPLMTIPDLIDAQAKRRPDACALVMGEEHLSYGELVRRADQLAQVLIARGIGAEVTVGIALERSLALVISLLAVLKAGGAYVPLDPTTPQERLAYYIQDARLSLILTQAQIEPVLPVFAGPILCIDREWHLISQACTQLPHQEIDPQQLAYLIYTSGSTGVPKGAMNAHAGVYNRVHWMKERYQLGPHERFLQKTPISFDVSVAEIFTPLISGASLVLAVPAGHKDPHYLAEIMAREAITTVHFVPSMLRFYLEEPDLERCTSLRRVMCSGEALTPALHERFFQRFTGVELHNLYGPTEAAVDVSFWNCQAEAAGHTVPIGQPIRQVSLYVLDERLQLLPVGVVGELYIGGIQVGRGYIRQADRTAEVFVPDPFGTGGRLYKTGDLARWRTDGSLEYLGRRDQQVKIRGFRVELGEIEAALQQQKGVRACVVVMWADDDGEQHLVAYVVGDQDQGLHALWRLQLSRILPAYMIPTHFVSIEALPISSHGKLDWKRLPAPNMHAVYATNSDEYVPPHDDLERQLVDIWEELLAVHPIGITSNFFALGGHSFSAIRLMSVLSKRFGRQLSLATFFQQATIEQLAAHMRRPVGLVLSTTLSEILPVGEKYGNPLFWIYPPGIDTPLYHDLTRSAGIERPCYGLHLPDWEHYMRIEDIAEFHVAKLRSVQPHGPYLLGGWSMGGMIAYEMARQLNAQGEEMLPLLLLDSIIQPPEQELPGSRRFYAGFLRHVGFSMAELQSLWNNNTSYSNEEEFLADVLIQAKSSFKMPQDTQFSDIQHLFAVYRWNMLILQTYIPQAYTGRIQLFRASEDPVALKPDWWHLFSANTVVYQVPGNHQSMLSEPHGRILAELLASILMDIEH